MKHNKSIVKLLTTAALALPGIQQVQAESPSPIPRAEFGYSNYDESGNRYKINVYQSRFELPVTEKTSISILTARDLQTGASFVFGEPQSLIYYGFAHNPGNPSIVEPVITAASITEVRDSFAISGSYYFPESILTVGYRYSTEDDYLSNSTDIEWRKLFCKKTRELTMGVGYSADNYKPTLDGVPGHLPRESVESSGEKSTFTAVLGLRQDISPKTTSRFGASYSLDRGYLGDPYKRVSIYGNATNVRPGSAFLPNSFFPFDPFSRLNIPAGLTVDYDRRPGKREMWSAMAEIIRYIEYFSSSVHAQYRYTQNTWGISSNMIEASYHQPFSRTWRFIPLARYYTQTEADFYSYMFAAQGGAPFPAKLLPVGLENSSDNRLSRFGTFNAQVSIIKQFPADIDLSFIGGIYASREWLHWGTDPEVSNPFNNYTSTYLSVNVGINFD